MTNRGIFNGFEETRMLVFIIPESGITLEMVLFAHFFQRDFAKKAEIETWTTEEAKTNLEEADFENPYVLIIGHPKSFLKGDDKELEILFEDCGVRRDRDAIALVLKVLGGNKALVEKILGKYYFENSSIGKQDMIQHVAEMLDPQDKSYFAFVLIDEVAKTAEQIKKLPKPKEIKNAPTPKKEESVNELV